MAGGFLTKRVLLTREAIPGVVPATPVCLEFFAESFDLKESQASEEINLLGTGGDASPMAFGTSTFNGSVGVVVSTDNIATILTHVLGAKISSGNASAVNWAATTAFAVGDIVNSVAKSTHSLVCYKAGTSGALETSFSPALTANPAADRGKKITDGTVIWIAMPKMLTYSFERKQQLPTFTIEYQLEDAAGTSFYRRFSNVYMNALPMGMTGGTISLKASLDFIAATATDSLQDSWTTPLASIAGAQIVPAFKEFFSYEDCTVKVDTVALCEVESINVDITRNVTVSDGVNNCKIPEIGILSAKGNINRVFTLDDYEKFDIHQDFALQFAFEKANGCKLTVNYPYIKPERSDPMHSIDKQAYLTAAISAYGITGTQSVNATIVVPSLVDSTGAVIGAY